MNRVRVSAVLLAGGSGSRFGAEGNKVFVKACHKPILNYSIEVIESHPQIEERILVTRAGDEAALSEIPFGKNWKIVTGGSTRQESVRHGLEAACGETVLIHDSARPMIRPSYITRCLQAMEEVPGCTIAVHVKDTIKLSDDSGLVRQTTERANTWIVQTPQCFRREILLDAHRRFADVPGITDDCMFLELAGLPVKLIEGDYTNIKVTTPEDLALAETFLEELKRT